jgi:hypothetical protein
VQVRLKKDASWLSVDHVKGSQVTFATVAILPGFVPLQSVPMLSLELYRMSFERLSIWDAIRKQLKKSWKRM